MGDFERFQKQAQEKVSSIVKHFKKSAGGGSGGRGRFFGPLLLAGAALTGIAIYSSVYSVEGGYRAIKFNRFTGVGSKVYKDGIHFYIPIIEWPIIYDIRTRPSSISSLTGSKDLQMVNLTVRVLHRPDADNLQQMYRTLGMNYAERVLPSIANEVLKSVIAKFTAAELLTKREVVSRRVTLDLKKRASEFGIVIEDVAITHLAFGKEYTSAVERKQIALQEAERAKFLVEKAEQEKKALIIKAEGEAASAKMIGQAMERDPGYLELRRIEIAKEIANILARSNNKAVLTSDSLLLNLNEASSHTQSFGKEQK